MKPAAATNDMTKASQNKAIAQWLGWTDLEFRGIIPPKELDWIGHHPSITPEGRSGKWSGRVPNYTSDLNAIHSAEDQLKDDECRAYVMTLENIDGPYLLSRYGLVHATARQRAEALLRALSLWEDK